MRYLILALIVLDIWLVSARAQQAPPPEMQLVQNLADSKKAVDTAVRGMWNDILAMFNSQQQELNKERDAVAWWAGCVKDQVCVEWAKGAPK